MIWGVMMRLVMIVIGTREWMCVSLFFVLLLVSSF